MKNREDLFLENEIFPREFQTKCFGNSLMKLPLVVPALVFALKTEFYETVDTHLNDSLINFLSLFIMDEEGSGKVDVTVALQSREWFQVKQKMSAREMKTEIANEIKLLKSFNFMHILSRFLECAMTSLSFPLSLLIKRQVKVIKTF